MSVVMPAPNTPAQEKPGHIHAFELGKHRERVFHRAHWYIPREKHHQVLQIYAEIIEFHPFCAFSCKNILFTVVFNVGRKLNRSIYLFVPRRNRANLAWGVCVPFANVYAELGTMAGFGIGCDTSRLSLRHTRFMQEIAHS